MCTAFEHIQRLESAWGYVFVADKMYIDARFCSEQVALERMRQDTMLEGTQRCADELIGCLNRLFAAPTNQHTLQPAEVRTFASSAQHVVPTPPQLFKPSHIEDTGSPERKPVLHRTAPTGESKEDAKLLLEKIKQRNREKQARHRARVKVCH
jgi:hypothetical protein